MRTSIRLFEKLHGSTTESLLDHFMRIKLDVCPSQQKTVIDMCLATTGYQIFDAIT